jgi:hypothetical protein
VHNLESNRGRHLNLAPDQRLGVAQLDANRGDLIETVGRRIIPGGSHAASLSGLFFQFQGRSSSSFDGVIVDAAKHIGEPGFRIDVVELGGGDEQVDSRSPLTAATGAAEGLVPAAKPNTAQRALGGIVGETDSAIVEEAGEGVPALQHVIHRFGDVVQYGGCVQHP